MSDFTSVFQSYTWEQIKELLQAKTFDDVSWVLQKEKRNIEDFLILISPAASQALEEMAYLSKNLTQRRFGKTIQLYAPLYLSNECQNICTYCGFSLHNKIKRKTLSNNELILEAKALKNMGIEHVLLVSGEANQRVGLPYFINAIELLRPYFANISIEVQPLLTEEYVALHRAGVYAVLVYQETYKKAAYKEYHPKGKKSNFEFRLNTPDRIGNANMHKMGLGVLLGLENWRVDSFFNALHIDYLQKTYWKTKYSVSFPRLRPARGLSKIPFEMKDLDLLQLICAYRIWNPDLDISISTRESVYFRDHIVSLGATTMSAASKTNPGGYLVDKQSLNQFEVSDERSVSEIKNGIQKAGYDPVMKDWEGVLSSK